jgi:hypothetical protein
MSARTDTLVSQAETGKMSTASIVPVVAGCHPARAVLTTTPDEFGSLKKHRVAAFTL